MFYCMFYFTCDRSLNSRILLAFRRLLEASRLTAADVIGVVTDVETFVVHRPQSTLIVLVAYHILQEFQRECYVIVVRQSLLSYINTRNNSCKYRELLVL